MELPGRSSAKKMAERRRDKRGERSVNIGLMTRDRLRNLTYPINSLE
jgi:hypothetical protein